MSPSAGRDLHSPEGHAPGAPPPPPSPSGRVTPPLGGDQAPPVAAPPPRPTASPDDEALLQRLRSVREALFAELGKVIVGQQEMLEQILVAMLCRGHCLLEGVPGLAKTLTVSTLSKALQLDFKRVQFTPDLMPSDILGTEVLDEDPTTRKSIFRFVKGPIFANLVLADEINRTPPKTQAALLEAMQERQVSAGGEIRPLPKPFFVLATQNPIEQEGTYPLPEAQLDRFMFNILLDYPTSNDEFEIFKRVTSGQRHTIQAVVNAKEDLIPLQELIRRIPVSDSVIAYVRNLVRATRPREPEATEQVKEYVGWGAGPRAGLCLIQGAKARAALEGRSTPSVEDVQSLAIPVLRHRIVLNFKADADNVSKDDLIVQLADEIARVS